MGSGVVHGTDNGGVFVVGMVMVRQSVGSSKIFILVNCV